MVTEQEGQDGQLFPLVAIQNGYKSGYSINPFAFEESNCVAGID